MDTVEELRGTYFYKGISNLSAGELFFWVFLDAVNEQLGTSEIAPLPALFLGNQPARQEESFMGQRKGRLSHQRWPDVISTLSYHSAFLHSLMPASER